MSTENVEAVRKMVDGLNRDGYIPEELVHPDLEWSNIPESPMPGPYRGHEGLRKWREDLFEVIEEGRFEIDEVVDLDEADAVLFKTRFRGRAKHTGIALNRNWTTVQWFREGRLSRSESYTDHAEALKAAGLQE